MTASPMIALNFATTLTDSAIETDVTSRRFLMVFVKAKRVPMFSEIHGVMNKTYDVTKKPNGTKACQGFSKWIFALWRIYREDFLSTTMISIDVPGGKWSQWTWILNYTFRHWFSLPDEINR
uniref:Uncharacterized protein n=1 Tax=Angiostrongylus cantonensis TaxID=6313 RepID=A0A0K0DBJ2_ANGCA